MKADYEDEQKQLAIIREKQKMNSNILELHEPLLGHEQEFVQNEEDLLKKPQTQQQAFQHQKKVQEYQMKLHAFQKRFVETAVDFKVDRENVFKIVDARLSELQILVNLWSSRQIKTDRYILTLELEQCKLDKEKIKNFFKPLPSIQVVFNGEKLAREGILKMKGDAFYEGTEDYMVILSNQYIYLGQVQNDLFHGKGRLQDLDKKNGFVYEGQFQNGKRHGKGAMHQKGVQYIGEFENNFKHGEGQQVTYKLSKKTVPGQGPKAKIKASFKGEFKEGYRNGYGVEQTSHGVYEGEWMDDLKHGQGQMKYKNGDHYKGSWEKGQFSGQGQYCELDNCTYTGDFKNGFYHGNGKMQYDNGDVYEGQFQFNKKHGQGKYDYVDGDYYDGQWKNDSAEGQGTSMMGQDFFVGEFKNGKKHGQGELTNGEGDVTHGIWQNNELVKTLEFNGQPVQED